MSKFSRRDFLKTTAGAAAAGGLGVGSAMWSQDAFAQAKWTPEKGAKLRVLRWKRFVQGDEDVWMQNTKKFADQYKVEVRVDHEGWEDDAGPDEVPPGGHRTWFRSSTPPAGRPRRPRTRTSRLSRRSARRTARTGGTLPPW